MLPQSHFLIGTIVSLFLYYVFPEIGFLNLVIFLLASVLIDVDHYLYYVYRKKNWGPINATKWFLEKGRILKNAEQKTRNEFYTGFYFLHGVEVLILLVILGYLTSSFFYFICLGFLLHLILDYVYQSKTRDRFDKFSIIYDYFKYRKLKFIDELDGLAKV
jgi:hypothetical protein